MKDFSDALQWARLIIPFNRSDLRTLSDTDLSHSHPLASQLTARCFLSGKIDVKQWGLFGKTKTADAIQYAQWFRCNLMKLNIRLHWFENACSSINTLQFLNRKCYKNASIWDNTHTFSVWFAWVETAARQPRYSWHAMKQNWLLGQCQAEMCYSASPVDNTDVERLLVIKLRLSFWSHE